jgi:hypothetical protein
MEIDMEGHEILDCENKQIRDYVNFLDEIVRWSDPR